MRVFLLLLLMSGVATSGVVMSGVARAESSPKGDARSEIERFCSNIADPARERRYALLKAEIETLEEGIDARMRALEAKRAAVEEWLEKRDAFLSRAQSQLVSIYAGMRPDAAAERLALLDDALAAGVVMKLSPKRAALVLNEMKSGKAAAISAVIAASVEGAS